MKISKINMCEAWECILFGLCILAAIFFITLFGGCSPVVLAEVEHEVQVAEEAVMQDLECQAGVNAVGVASP
jgi:hypothetical protein